MRDLSAAGRSGKVIQGRAFGAASTAAASSTSRNRFRALVVSAGLCSLPAASCSQNSHLAAASSADIACTFAGTTMNDAAKKDKLCKKLIGHEEGDDADDNRSDNDDPWSKIGGGAINEKKRRGIPPGNGEQSDTINDSSQDADSDSSTVAFNPRVHKTHLWHALEGLDRYPNYLSRWNNVEDMNRLEEALKERLSLVQQQRHDILQRRDQIQRIVQELVASSSNDKESLEGLDTTTTTCSSWKWLIEGPTSWQQVQDHILDARICQAIFQSKTFRPSSETASPSFADVPTMAAPPTLAQVLSGNVAVELDASLLQTVMEEEMYDVYSLPLLSPAFCQQVREYIQAFTKLAQERAPASELNNAIVLRPVDLDTVGLQWINDLLFHLIVRPISRHLFLKTEAWKDLDWRQGYIAAYAARPATDKPRERLVTHTDDAEVTLNVCLGEPDYVGGHVEFRNLRGTSTATNGQEEGQLLGTVERPNVGTALLHAGRHFHTVTRVESGNRFALIVWSRSWQGVRAQQCPCCWLNRRPGSVLQETNDCVCGPRWN
jgi:hypothetical protein